MVLGIDTWHNIFKGEHLADSGLDTFAQNKEMRRYTATPRYESRPRGEVGITAQYLEAMDDDDLGGDSDDADGLTATERARNALRRNVHVRWPALVESLVRLLAEAGARCPIHLDIGLFSCLTLYLLSLTWPTQADSDKRTARCLKQQVREWLQGPCELISCEPDCVKWHGHSLVTILLWEGLSL